MTSEGSQATLKKKIVSCVPGREKNSQSGGRESSSFFFPNFIFYKLECIGGESKKK